MNTDKRATNVRVTHFTQSSYHWADETPVTGTWSWCHHWWRKRSPGGQGGPAWSAVHSLASRISLTAQLSLTLLMLTLTEIWNTLDASNINLFVQYSVFPAGVLWLIMFTGRELYCDCGPGPCPLHCTCVLCTVQTPGALGHTYWHGTSLSLNILSTFKLSRAIHCKACRSVQILAIITKKWTLSSLAGVNKRRASGCSDEGYELMTVQRCVDQYFSWW